MPRWITGNVLAGLVIAVLYLTARGGHWLYRWWFYGLP